MGANEREWGTNLLGLGFCTGGFMARMLVGELVADVGFGDAGIVAG